NLAGAVVSYVAAMVALNRHMPEGAAGRLRTTATGLLVFMPVLAVGQQREAGLPHAASIVGRLLLIPVAIFGTLACGLVREDDFDRLVSFPLQSSWMDPVRE